VFGLEKLHFEEENSKSTMLQLFMRSNSG